MSACRIIATSAMRVYGSRLRLRAAVLGGLPSVMSIDAGSRTTSASSVLPAVLTMNPWPPMIVASADAMYIVVTPPESSSLLRRGPGLPAPKVPYGL